MTAISFSSTKLYIIFHLRVWALRSLTLSFWFNVTFLTSSYYHNHIITKNSLKNWVLCFLPSTKRQTDEKETTAKRTVNVRHKSATWPPEYRLTKEHNTNKRVKITLWNNFTDRKCRDVLSVKQSKCCVYLLSDKTPVILILLLSVCYLCACPLQQPSTNHFMSFSCLIQHSWEYTQLHEGGASDWKKVRMSLMYHLKNASNAKPCVHQYTYSRLWSTSGTSDPSTRQREFVSKSTCRGRKPSQRSSQ